MHKNHQKFIRRILYKSLLPFNTKKSKIDPIPKPIEPVKFQIGKIFVSFVYLVLHSKSPLNSLDVGWSASHFSSLNFPNIRRVIAAVRFRR
jgi:hypothetical protein